VKPPTVSDPKESNSETNRFWTKGQWRLVAKAFGQRVEKMFEIGDFGFPDKLRCKLL